MTRRIVQLAAIAAFTALSVASLSFAQEPVSPQRDATQGVESGTEVTIDDALAQSESGATIPLSRYSFSGSRGSYKGVLVGGNPWNPKPATINAVWIPLIIQIKKSDGTVVTFDPTAPDSCDPNDTSPAIRFLFSPLVLPANLIFNGVSVGAFQYIDGFMQAEFWNETGGSSSYSNFITWVDGAPVSFPLVSSSDGTVTGTGCNEEGYISKSFFSSTMKGSIIPSLQAAGVISPAKFAFFLTKNVQTASTLSPSPSGIGAGAHFAGGSPVQTWAWARYNETSDVSTASHEVGEWMNDPLVTNSTPAWGDEGEIKFPNCSSKFEVGDPLNHKNVLLKSVLSPYEYHVQELAFFSWFYNAKSAASIGAGGKFSSHGKFTGPSKACPPGGTY